MFIISFYAVCSDELYVHQQLSCCDSDILYVHQERSSLLLSLLYCYHLLTITIVFFTCYMTVSKTSASTSTLPIMDIFSNTSFICFAYHGPSG